MISIIFIVVVCSVVGAFGVWLYNIVGRRDEPDFYVIRRILIGCQVAATLVAVYFVDKHNDDESRLMTQCLQDHREYECEAMLHRRGGR